MEIEVPYRNIHQYTQLAEPLLRLRLADDASAERLANAWNFYDWLSPAFFAPVALIRAEQHERAGRPADALREYDRVLELWSDPDQELRPEIARIRERVRRLRG